MSLSSALPTADEFRNFLDAPGTTREAIIEASNEVAKGLFLDFSKPEIKTTAIFSSDSLIIFTWGALDMMKVDRDVLSKMMDITRKSDYNAGMLLTGNRDSYEDQIRAFLYPSAHQRAWHLDTSDLGYRIDMRKEAGLVDGRQKNSYYALTIPKEAFREFAADPAIEVAIRLEMNRVFRRAGDSEFIVKLGKGVKAPAATEKELREVLVDVIRDRLGPALNRSAINRELRFRRKYDKISYDDLDDLVNRAMTDILNG